GVHLILATQRPEGVVTGPIQANANFRICLRVVDAGDSMNMIGTRDAADIPPRVPGRAYLRVAQGEPVLFQTTRIAGSSLEGGVAFRASLFAPEGRPPSVPRHIGAEVEDEAGGAEDRSDLTALVAHIRTEAETQRITRLASPWADPLPRRVVL